MRSAVLVAVLVLPGCEQQASKSGAPAASTKEPAATLVGIWPKEWTCDRIATPAEIGGLLGGTAREIDSPNPARPLPFIRERHLHATAASGSPEHAPALSGGTRGGSS